MVSKGYLKRLAMFALLLAALPAWAGLSARIDRSQLRVGESFQLLIEKSGRYSGEGPDLTPLEAAFDLLGNARSSQISVVNGQMDSSTRWTITLAPKRAGTLDVPGLELDGEWTPSFPIQVGDATSDQGGGKDPANAGSDLFMEVEATPETPYLQSQLTYRVRIFRGVDFSDASLSDPEVEGAMIERLGEDVSYSTTRGGRRYQVIERRYAIFPERAGPLKIGGPLLNAEIPERAGGGWRDPFQGIFTRTRPVQIKAENRTVEILPPREQGEWLPAEGVTLTESWSPEEPKWRVGEPVTRVLTLRATGVTGAQLPPIHREVQGAVNGYPDQPKIEDSVEDERIVGTRTERIALVPSRPGPFTLPEIRVHWWDTETDQPRDAVIPARTFQVVAADGSRDAVPPAESQPMPAPPAAEESAGNSVAGDIEPDPSAVSEHPWWRWSALLFGGLWLITLLLWWGYARRHRGSAEIPGGERSLAEPPMKEGEARKRLRSACDANDATAARVALLAWGSAQWPRRPPLSLGELAGRFGEGEAADAIRVLDRILYHPEKGEWDGKGWLARVSPALKAGDETVARDSLIPQLYGS